MRTNLCANNTKLKITNHYFKAYVAEGLLSIQLDTIKAITDKIQHFKEVYSSEIRRLEIRNLGG